MCQFATPDCGSVCRPIKTVRELSRSRVGLEAREYLINVERNLLGMRSCNAPFGTETLRQPVPMAAE